MKGFFLALLAAFSLLSALSVAQAATIYIRFEGVINSWYNPNATISDGYFYEPDPDLGLLSSQTVWFDFAYDLSLDAPGHPDAGVADNFYAEYLGGSIPVGGETWGANNYYAGPSSGQLIIETNSPYRLLFGWIYNGTGDNVLRTVDTWEVGGGPNISLAVNHDWHDNIIAWDFHITYMGSVAPPAMVPLPAAFYLFGSALGLLSWLRRKTA